METVLEGWCVPRTCTIRLFLLKFSHDRLGNKMLMDLGKDFHMVNIMEGKQMVRCNTRYCEYKYPSRCSIEGSPNHACVTLSKLGEVQPRGCNDETIALCNGI